MDNDTFVLLLLGIICCLIIGIFFIIQMKFFLRANRKIFKLTPILFSIAMFLGCYIKYYAETYLLEKKGAITLAFDYLDMEFFVYGTIIIMAIIGCILGLIVCKI